MTVEQLAACIRERHGLSSLNLWHLPLEQMPWHARAFRADPKGFQASCETGGGMTIKAALESLDERLTAGPIAKPRIPMLDQEQTQR